MSLLHTTKISYWRSGCDAAMKPCSWVSHLCYTVRWPEYATSRSLWSLICNNEHRTPSTNGSAKFIPHRCRLTNDLMRLQCGSWAMGHKDVMIRERVQLPTVSSSASARIQTQMKVISMKKWTLNYLVTYLHSTPNASPPLHTRAYSLGKETKLFSS